MISSSASLAIVLLSNIDVLPALLRFTCDPLGVRAPVLVGGLVGRANPEPGGDDPLNEFLLKFFTILPTFPPTVRGPPILGPLIRDVSCCAANPEFFCGETLREEVDPLREGTF